MENTQEIPEIDTRFKENKSVLSNTFQKLTDEGYQRWLPPVYLSKTKFQPDARFETVDTKTPEDALQEIIAEAEKEANIKFEGKIVVEILDQNQKRAHIFLRLSKT